VAEPRCIDCRKEGVVTVRKASGKPLLCATHRRARRTSRRNYSHDRHIVETYGIDSAEYAEIYESQGRMCAICNRNRGVSKKLSVDHCHETGVIRGLLCGPCNRDVLGHLRDDKTSLQRAIDYLTSPPAVAVIGVRITPDMVDQDLTMNEGT